MRLSAVVVLLVTALVHAGQDQPFRASVEGVELDVAVTRGDGPVRGLTARDFVVTDNGVVQDVTSVMLEEAPLSVALVLDVSRSVSGSRLQQLIGAGVRLADSLRQDDEAALITFSHKVELRVPATREASLLKQGLASLTGIGSTSLRDAVYLATQLQPTDRSRRPLILLFSDGDDTSSWLTEAQVLEAARRSAAVVHIVTVQRRPFLDRLGDSTGGRVWLATSNEQLQELFSQALQDMRSRYLLTYSPRTRNAPGWHAIKVALRNQRAAIVARPGYFVPEP